jgi:hypothetical protein
MINLGFDPACVLAGGVPDYGLSGSEIQIATGTPCRVSAPGGVPAILAGYRVNHFPNWFAIGLRLVCNWFAVGLQLVCNWFAIGLQ